MLQADGQGDGGGHGNLESNVVRQPVVKTNPGEKKDKGRQKKEKQPKRVQ